MTSHTSLVHKIIILWVVVWLLESISGVSGRGLAPFFEWNPALLLEGDFSALPGFILYAFGHEPFPGFGHIFFNAYLFWAFAQEVEVLYRGSRFLKLMFASLLAGSLAQLLLYLLLGGAYAIPVTGGSGMVMTALAVQAAVYPDRVLSLILFRCRLICFFLALLTLDGLGFLYSLWGRGGGIATHVHLAGAAVGWWWAGGFQRTPKWWANLKATRQQRAKHSQKSSLKAGELELDRILAKISKEGMPSLTPQERSFLENRSRNRG